MVILSNCSRSEATLERLLLTWNELKAAANLLILYHNLLCPKGNKIPLYEECIEFVF